MTGRGNVILPPSASSFILPPSSFLRPTSASPRCAARRRARPPGTWTRPVGTLPKQLQPRRAAAALTAGKPVSDPFRRGVDCCGGRVSQAGQSRATAGASAPPASYDTKFRSRCNTAAALAGMTMARAAATTSRPSTAQLSQAAQPAATTCCDRPAAFRLPAAGSSAKPPAAPPAAGQFPAAVTVAIASIEGRLRRELVLPVVEITEIVLTRRPPRPPRAARPAGPCGRLPICASRIRPTLAAPRPVPTRIGNSSRGAK